MVQKTETAATRTAIPAAVGSMKSLFVLAATKTSDRTRRAGNAAIAHFTAASFFSSLKRESIADASDHQCADMKVAAARYSKIYDPEKPGNRVMSGVMRNARAIDGIRIALCKLLVSAKPIVSPREIGIK
jgi:hypothetical protein